MRRSVKPNATPTRREWPVVVYVWMISLGVAGYLIARVGLDAMPHPVHWTAGLIGAGIGYLAGWAWYRWQGDII